MSRYFDKTNRDRDVIIHEVDEGQRCLSCKERCSGYSPHTWRIICVNCKCPRISHDLYHSEFVDVKNRIGLKTFQDPNKVSLKRKTLNEGYSWIPEGLNSQKIQNYFLQIPVQKVPRLGTSGEKYRDRQLIIQLPKQDFALHYCRFLDREYRNNFYEFINCRNEKALDIGYVKSAVEQTTECFQCSGAIFLGDVGVIAPRFGERVLWHPSCFICNICNELLVDLVYCMKDRKLYCERHYAEEIKPRCSACDELIFAKEYTKAMSRDWHTTHFSCWKCDDSLTGQRYVTKKEQPYCIRCFERMFSNNCDECGRTIGVDSKDLSYKDKHWHESCFVCYKCHERLIDKPFGSKENKIYCAICYDASFSTRCDGCNEIFRAGTKKMEYKGKHWHENCFCCDICKSPIGNKSFVPRDNNIHCITCYEQKFSIKCNKCHQTITSSGVTYRNEPWHRECFCCTNCQRCLSGQNFTSRDEKPYCAECFGELFAKRCTVCNKPIAGVAGTKFIFFENRNWHKDCFFCAICKISLVGKGFIIDGSDILCPECSKQKILLPVNSKTKTFTCRKF